MRHRFGRLRERPGRCWVALGGLIALAACCSGASGAPLSGSSTLTLYSVSSQVQYVNNADDRSRGQGTNPFGNYSANYVAPPTNERLFGPFPGDMGEFASTLYTSAGRSHLAGKAVVICQYSFDQDMFCDAEFQLAGGSLIAKGSGNFNSTDLTLEVVGGTYRYRGSKGTVALHALGTGTDTQTVSRATPILEQQRLSFVIHHV